MRHRWPALGIVCSEELRRRRRRPRHRDAAERRREFQSRAPGLGAVHRDNCAFSLEGHLDALAVAPRLHHVRDAGRVAARRHGVAAAGLGAGDAQRVLEGRVHELVRQHDGPAAQVQHVLQLRLLQHCTRGQTGEMGGTGTAVAVHEASSRHDEVYELKMTASDCSTPAAAAAAPRTRRKRHRADAAAAPALDGCHIAGDALCGPPCRAVHEGGEGDGVVAQQHVRAPRVVLPHLQAGGREEGEAEGQDRGKMEFGCKHVRLKRQ